MTDSNDWEALEEPETVYLKGDPKGLMKRAYEGMMQIPEDAYEKEDERNAFQAYLASGLKGPITWAFTQVAESAAGEPLYVPSIYDLAGGMTAQEMRNHLQLLYNSGGETEGKHGVGARNSALRAVEKRRQECLAKGLPAPPGTEWWSYKNGIFSGFKIWIETPEKWASKIYEDVDVEDISYEFPQEILDAGHGTVIFFPGLEALPASKMPSESKIKGISKRWYDLPSGIVIKAQRCRTGETGAFVEVPTQKQALEALSEQSFNVQLSDCKIVVYILRSDLAGVAPGNRFHYADLYRTKDGSGENATPKARIGVVYENEFYSYTSGGGVHNQLRTFGITHGHRRVVLLMFPDPTHFRPDLLRNRLAPVGDKTEEGVDLPTARWAAEFSQVMPDGLRKYVEDSAIGTEAQNMQVIDAIIQKNAQYLSGPARRPRVKPQEEENDSEVAVKDEGPDEPDGTKRGPPRKKKPRKKTKGKLTETNQSKRFTPPEIRWVTPERDDDLYTDSGIYLPNAPNSTGGSGLLQLNENWEPLIRWRDHIMSFQAEDNATSTMVEHFTKQTMAFIHIDTIMKARLHKLPDPSSEDFKNAMLLPCLRDMAYDEVVKCSSKVLEE